MDSKFTEHFIPDKDIGVDESIVKSKEKIAFITYNPQKPTKWGLRIYLLPDAETGYVCSILPYFGSLTTEGLEKPELSVSSRIPLTLVKKLLDSIWNVVMMEKNNNNDQNDVSNADVIIFKNDMAQRVFVIRSEITCHFRSITT